MNQRVLIIMAIFMLSCCNDSNIDAHTKNSKSIQQQEKSKTKIEKEEIEVADYKKKDALITNYNVIKKLTAYGRVNPETKIKIKTSFGSIKIKLYEDTPLHRANFIMLIKKKYFDSTLFYRVIRNFMIQGGNSDRDNVFHKMAKIGNYKIPSEIKKEHLHTRGALAMAVQEQYYIDSNKHDKNSSPYNFYIVQNPRVTDKYMDALEKQFNIKIGESKRKIYKKQGGNPHLDNDYTVFGKVYAGMNIVDKICNVLTDANNRPLKNIFLTIEIIE